MKRRQPLVKIIFLSVLALGAFLMLGQPWKNDSPLPVTSAVSSPGPKPASVTQTDSISAEAFQQDVPFILQAPLGNWNDPVFQNACEEASALMAMAWVDNQPVSPQNAYLKIQDIANFEDTTFGFNTDTSVFDVQKIFRDFFHYQNTETKENVTLNDLIGELRNGNIIIAPVAGRSLGNPYYAPPGPIAHMFVITGYDPVSKEFITNDPGTSHGRGFRYREDILFSSLWSYPSGPSHPVVPSKEFRKTAILIVRPR